MFGYCIIVPLVKRHQTILSGINIPSTSAGLEVAVFTVVLGLAHGDNPSWTVAIQ